jgi:hypothetical protein
MACPTKAPIPVATAPQKVTLSTGRSGPARSSQAPSAPSTPKKHNRSRGNHGDDHVLCRRQRGDRRKDRAYGEHERGGPGGQRRVRRYVLCKSKFVASMGRHASFGMSCFATRRARSASRPRSILLSSRSIAFRHGLLGWCAFVPQLMLVHPRPTTYNAGQKRHVSCIEAEQVAKGVCVRQDGTIVVAYGSQKIAISKAQYRANGYSPPVEKLPFESLPMQAKGQRKAHRITHAPATASGTTFVSQLWSSKAPRQ